MATAFKRKYMAILGLLVAFSTQLSGLDYNQNNCVADCCETQDCIISFEADLLLWRPQLCGLESAFGNTSIDTFLDANGITTTTIRESHRKPHSKWNAGFRIAADVAMNDFDLEAKWTHFKGHANYSADEQSGRWKIRYDVIDLTLGHQFCMSSCFNVRPYIGLRAARIHQSLKSHLETTLTSSITGNSIAFTDMDDKEDFWGVGPQIGLGANWNIGCDLSLYGDLAVVSYYGDVKGRNRNTDTVLTSVDICNGRNDHCFNNIGTDAEIGIRWDKSSSCSCGCINYMVKLGLEQHRIYDFSYLGSDGNLTLDGAVIGAGISFNY
ncbi:MAG: Lpg1974 family pore-forming outer membrane protein [Parachlamydiales bacterium]|jgi:hypothetical protein